MRISSAFVFSCMRIIAELVRLFFLVYVLHCQADCRNYVFEVATGSIVIVLGVLIRSDLLVPIIHCTFYGE